VAFEMRRCPKPVDILIGEVVKVKNPRYGKDMTAMVEDKFKPMRMDDYGIFGATKKRERTTRLPLQPEKGCRRD
jgi:hypothetical protein